MDHLLQVIFTGVSLKYFAGCPFCGNVREQNNRNEWDCLTKQVRQSLQIVIGRLILEHSDLIGTR